MPFMGPFDVKGECKVAFAHKSLIVMIGPQKLMKCSFESAAKTLY